MKTILTVLAIMLMASFASASPFLVCDPQPTAVGLSFEIREGTKVVYSGINQADGSIKVDLKDCPVGTRTITARYVSTDLLWGTTYSADSPPFTFTRPPIATGNIVGLKLVSQPLN